MSDPLTAFLAETPPRVALVTGVSMGLALKRARIESVLDRFLPTQSK